MDGQKCQNKIYPVIPMVQEKILKTTEYIGKSKDILVEKNIIIAHHSFHTISYDKDILNV